MGTEIQTWQILNGTLVAATAALKDNGRTEPYDLEPWLVSNSEIIGNDIMIIGRQVKTRSGPIDLLAIDQSGNTVIVEIKRDELPREALAQAIDYASDVAEWTAEKLSEVFAAFSAKSLQDEFAERFPDADTETVTLNESQRIVLVGFSIEGSLARMIEWLSDSYNVNINAVVLSYVRTASGEELLTRTSVISEETEEVRRRKEKKFEIAMDDRPGKYDIPMLKERLHHYLLRDKVTNIRLRDVVFPALLKTRTGCLTREQLKKAFVDSDAKYDEAKVGYYVSLLSTQLGLAKNDFLRQVISYEYPRHPWEKDNFAIRDQYRGLVGDIIGELT